MSGTTVVTTLFDRNVIHVANVGDSRGILVREAAGGDKAGQVRGAPSHWVLCKADGSHLRACVWQPIKGGCRTGNTVTVGSEQLQVVELTFDHKPSRASEAARIKESDAVIYR